MSRNGGSWCGRTAVALDPDGIRRGCHFRNRAGRRIRPRWRGAGGGAAAGGRGGASDAAGDGASDGGKKRDTSYKQSYNVSPGSHTPVLVAADHFDDETEKTDQPVAESDVMDVVIQPMKWGLVPSWCKTNGKDFSYKTNNCRSETMLTKNLYKTPLDKGRRCVVVADGFYEWKTDPKTKTKQAYFIYFPKSATSDPDELAKNKMADAKEDEEPYTGPRLLTMAGIFNRSHPKDSDEPLYSYTIITTDASPQISPIHHRMPAILDGDDEVFSWLNHGEVPLKSAVDLIKPKSCLAFHPVSNFVNKVQNDSEECIKRVEETKTSKTSGLMTSWLKRKSDSKTESSEEKKVKTEN